MSFLVPAGSTMIRETARQEETCRRKSKRKKEKEKRKGNKGLKKKVSRPRSRRRPSMKRSFTVRVQYAAIKREVYETRNRETGLRRRGAMSGMLLASAERGSQTGTFLFIFGVPEDLLWKTSLSLSSILPLPPFRTSNSNSLADPVLSFIFFRNDCSFLPLYSIPSDYKQSVRFFLFFFFVELIFSLLTSLIIDNLTFHLVHS